MERILLLKEFEISALSGRLKINSTQNIPFACFMFLFSREKCRKVAQGKGKVLILALRLLHFLFLFQDRFHSELRALALAHISRHRSWLVSETQA